DRIEPAYQRYVAQPVSSRHEIWTFRHKTCYIAREKTLRLFTGAPAAVRWSSDAWQHAHDSETKSSGLPDLFFADLPTADLPAGTVVEFTFHWPESENWKVQSVRVAIA